MPRHLPLAALLTAGAGATHLAAAVPHFASTPLYGTLFVAAGWIQVLLAAVLLTRGRVELAWAAVVVNATAVVAWAVSRTVGLPLAHPEPVLLADAVTVALEVAAIGVLIARLRGATFGFRGGQATALSVVAVLALATGGSTLAIAGLGTGDAHHGEASEQGESTEGDGHAHAGDDSGDSEGPGGQEQPAAVHEHPDGTMHVHEAGTPHVHPDRTVHVHTAERSAPDKPAGAQDTGSEQDDGHNHDSQDAH